jgi:putative peptide zinc metalloprotease protein
VGLVGVSQSFFSHAWYRVSHSCPRLKAHVQIQPQRFRGQLWYVLRDPQQGTFHRLSESAYLSVSLMDGARAVEAIWHALGERLGDEQPTQDEVVRLLRQLHAADLLTSDSLPDLSELSRRREETAQRKRAAQWRNPIAVRISLWDPNQFLGRTLPWVAWAFTPAALLGWLAIVAAGILLATLHWQTLVANVADRALAPSNIVLMLLIYPCVKALHELGHGWAARRWGGEVHEIGVMMMALFPVPYVDASESAGFQSKWQRAVVGAAGIMVELLLAAFAMFVWLLVEPGLVRAIAFNVMLIAGISTVLFNGNPLLRYDGYYVLSDLLEIPNLGPRSNQYLLYLTKSRLLGVRSASAPSTAPGEIPWLIGYGIASFIYRISITSVIALYLAKRAFILGVILALLALFNAVVLPVYRGVHYLAFSLELRGRRGRALSAVGITAAVLLLIIFVIPAPYATVAQGVVWLPDAATVRAGTGGTIERLLAQPGALVRPGDAVIELSDPTQDERIAALEARQREISLRLDAAMTSDRVGVGIYHQQMQHVSAALEQERARRGELIVRANAAGRLAFAAPEDLPGRTVERGMTLGYVIDAERPLVRAIVDQDDVELILQRLIRTQIRFVQKMREPREATAVRATPAAVETLPSPVLGKEGGGPWAEVPDGSGPPRLVQKAFVMDFRVQGGTPGATVGSRVYLRFDHGHEPLGWRWLRSLRQLFLRQLNV